MKGKALPTYDLTEVQRKVAAGEYLLTRSAQASVEQLAFDRDDVVRCLLSLHRADFYKSMEAERVPGFWQDVYRPWFREIQLYVKLQINAAERAVVISFKER